MTPARTLIDAPASDWTLRVVLRRIERYDGYSAYAIRWALWCALLVIMWAATPAWWAWLLLIPGAIHSPLQIATLWAHDLGLDLRFLRWLERSSGNGGQATWAGTAVGLIAAVAQLVAAVWAFPDTDPFWARPLGTVLALLYLNSVVGAIVCDSAFYNPRNTGRRWRWARAVRAAIGPLLTVGAMALALPRPWPFPSIGGVLILCLPLAITYKMTVFDTALRAAQDTLPGEHVTARQRFFDGLHSQLTGPVKAASRLILNHEPPVSGELREMGLVLPLLLSDTRELVDEPAWEAQTGSTSVRESVQSLSARSQVRTRYLDDGSLLDATNKHLALVTLANLIPNAAAAQRAVPGPGLPPPVGVRVVTLSSGTVAVAVSDAAPMVPAEFWCAPGTSLGLLRSRLRQLGGDLVQIDDGDGKTVAATWRHAQGGTKR